MAANGQIRISYDFYLVPRDIETENLNPVSGGEVAKCVLVGREVFNE